MIKTSLVGSVKKTQFKLMSFEFPIVTDVSIFFLQAYHQMLSQQRIARDEMNDELDNEEADAFDRLRKVTN